jgi:hypothetical protein
MASDQRPFIGSRDLGDDEFVRHVESCCLAKARWRHGDHLRLAWCYMGRYDAREAEERAARTIRAYSASLGLEQKYHETVTRAWMRLVSVARTITPDATSFEDLLQDHPWLLHPDHLRRFYSVGRLDAGRAAWIAPDLQRFPCGYWCCQ